MPKNQFQRMVFAFLTVIITVHAYVFYSLYVINGNTLMQITGESNVLAAIRAQGGVYMFGQMLPIWAVVIIEFLFAYALENLIGSPLSFRLACRVFDPRRNHPMLFESAIICATVGIMCPSMSFLAAWFYYPYYNGFHILTLLANWLKLICFNFPFAYFSQMFFIQPFVRVIFKLLFHKQIEARTEAQHEAEAEGAKTMKPVDETEAIADVWKRIGEIQEELAHERRQRKKIQEELKR
ncbi:hypothetical protein [Blautia obeum]|uniref:hypothetical protein n=1 Tax=Blautia obeum TaxID=40520 RepID=UPI002A7678B1|nr:hypothetical protein [Lachnospiraceae bacterium]MCI6534880.1 hypothetical protein [Lachnospiraceae bacterium]MDY2613131.1 hypothetical protein [Lachnospiraceae bacterium]MDY4206187.1 hypothetical protein [Lachnospiraceae bacterium]